MHVVSFITEPGVIRRIVDHLRRRLDYPHASRAERGEHLEGAQARAGFEGHRSFRAAEF
jgi:hypothetical protein